MTTPATPPRAVRLSLTDRCDLACIYCRPHKRDGYLEKRLDLKAWRLLVAGLVRAGVRRVRITGGEPLLFPEVVAFVRALADLGLEDVALTTNATRLEALARPLRDAGLHRLNVSIDTLDPHRFFRMTRGGNLSKVLAGIEAARDAGFSPIKLNTVVVRDENDDEIESLTRWAWDRGLVPRFLEVMPIGEGQSLAHRVVSFAEIRARLAHLTEPGDAEKEADRGPARYLVARHDPRLRVGFISGTTDTFCKGCDRLRVASDGTLRPCLATNDGLSPQTGLAKKDADLVADAVLEAWKMKPDGEVWKGCTEETARSVSIRQIGG
jgi:cyclic pyranopterin phosphate synthase